MPKYVPVSENVIKNGEAHWQYLDWEPGLFYPADENLFVNEAGDMTIEFLFNEAGEVTGVMERWEDRRNKIPHKL